jgi:hypothetical protein
MLRIAAAVFAATLLAPWSGFASPITCKQLVSECNAGISGACMNPISGALMVGVHNGKICLEQYTWAGLVGVMNHWADTNPKLLNISAWDCAGRALSEVFPCKN